MLVRQDENQNFEKLQPGTYQAVCYAVWDLGMQRGSFNGEEKIQHKIVIAWEVNQRMTQEGKYKGKRFVVFKEFTLSLSTDANLFKLLNAWRGKELTKEELKAGIELNNLVGANCMIGIINNKKEKPTVSTVLRLPMGMEKIQQEISQTPPKWVTDKMALQVVTGVQSAPMDPNSIGEPVAEDFPADAFMGESDPNVPF